MPFKLATWNVNGIRARQTQLHEFLDAEQPDVLCLQEIKASLDQLPVWLCDMEGYWCYWHGGKGYSGVGLHVRKTTGSDRPAFRHPDFDYENRIVTVDLPLATVASIYVPNGGKDFPAKMRFLEALNSYSAEFQTAAARDAVRDPRSRAVISMLRAPTWTCIRRSGVRAPSASYRKNVR